MLSKVSISEEMISRSLLAAQETYHITAKPHHIAELIDLYLEACEPYYARSRYLTIRQALARLHAVAGDKPIDEMDVPTLHAARHLMVEGDCCLNTISLYVQCIRQMFTWAEVRSLCPSDLPERLARMAPLRRGKTDVRDTEPVTSAPPQHLKMAFRRLREYRRNPQDAMKDRGALMLWCMLGVQLRTGMRPGELCSMRWSEIDVSESPWCFNPEHHKTKHHNLSRRIWIGPKAQRLILRWCAESGGGDQIFQITRTAYRRKLHRWLKALDVLHFFPNQLRHNFATRLERIYDERTVQKLLSHMSLKTTRGYIDPDTDTAIQAIREIG